MASDIFNIGMFNDRIPGLGSGCAVTTPVKTLNQPWPFTPGLVVSTALGGNVHPFPYADLIRVHLAQGRIRAARELLDYAQRSVPLDPGLVRALAPPKVRKIVRRDVDREADYRWLQSNQTEHGGQWVALDGGALVAAAPTLAELMAKLKAAPSSGKPLIQHLD